MTGLVPPEVDVRLRAVESRRRQVFAIGAVTAVATAGLALLGLTGAAEVPFWVGLLLLAATLLLVVDGWVQERRLAELTRAAIAERDRGAELAATVEDLATLVELTREVNASLLPEEVYAVVLDGAVQLLRGDHGEIRLRVGDRVVVAAGSGPGAAAIGAATPLQEDRGAVCVQLGVTVQEDDPPLLAVPITVGRRHVGVLEVGRPSGEEPFGDRLSLLAQLFAAVAATAFANANRFDHERTRAEGLAAATEDRSDAIADTVHDLRAPMAGLLGYAQLLRDRFDELGPARRQEAVEAVVTQSELLNELVGSVFEVTSVEARATRTRDPVDVGGVVRQAVSTVTAAGEHNGRSAVIEVDAPPGLTVLGDAEALLRIVTNLVDNAVEHGGGADVTVRAERRGREVRLHVADRGEGIPADRLDDLFRRGGRADGSPRGRGLSIVHGLVQALGGEVAVRSREGVGSVFSVRFPAA